MIQFHAPAHSWGIALAVLCVALVLLIVKLVRMSRWWKGAGAHHQAPQRPAAAPAAAADSEPRVFVHPRSGDPLPDQEHRRDLLNTLTDFAPDPIRGDDVRSAWVQEPRRTVTAERPPWESAEMPKLLMPLPDWHTQDPRPTVTVGLPPWEGPAPAIVIPKVDLTSEEAQELKARFLAAVERGDPPVVLEDLPAPVVTELRPRRKRRPWTGSLGLPDPLILFLPARTVSPAPAPDQSARLPHREEEFDADTLEGVVVESPVLSDTWFEEQMASIVAWRKAEEEALKAWSRRELVSA